MAVGEVSCVGENSAPFFHTPLNKSLTFLQAGLYRLKMQGRQTFSCVMDFTKYPFDSQRCKVSMYLSDLNTKYVNITLLTDVTVEELQKDRTQRILQYEVRSRKYKQNGICLISRVQINGIVFNKEDGLFIPKLVKNKNKCISNTGACTLLTVSVINICILFTCVARRTCSDISQF